MALNILKIRYMYLTVTSSNAVFSPKFPIMTQWVNICYVNFDLLTFMMLSAASNIHDFGYYTLINHDCFSALFLFGFFMAHDDEDVKNVIILSGWKLFKNSLLNLLFYFQLLLIAIFYGSAYAGIGLLPLFIISLLIDYKNDKIMNNA